MFCLFLLVSFPPNCCNNRNAEINFKVTAVAPTYVFYLVMGITCKFFSIPGLKAFLAAFMSSWQESFFDSRLYIKSLYWYLISLCQYLWSAEILPHGDSHGHRLFQHNPPLKTKQKTTNQQKNTQPTPNFKTNKLHSKWAWMIITVLFM